MKPLIILTLIALSSCTNPSSRSPMKSNARSSLKYLTEIEHIYRSNKKYINEMSVSDSSYKSRIIDNSFVKKSCQKLETMFNEIGFISTEIASLDEDEKMAELISLCTCKPNFQKRYLNEMKIAVFEEKLDNFTYAKVLDNIQILKSNQQIYGTRKKIVWSKSAAEVSIPLVDKDKVDKERLIIGLDSLTIALDKYLKDCTMSYTYDSNIKQDYL